MLAASPIDDLKKYLDGWATTLLSCEPAERATAEEGVRLAYASAGLGAPCIVWCASPLEIARRLADAPSADPIGRNVKEEVFDEVRDRLGTFAEVFWKEIIVAATELRGDDRFGAALDIYNARKTVGLAIDRVVRNAATDLLSRFTVRARHAAHRLRGQPRLLPRGSFGNVAIGPCELASLAVYEYLHDVVGWQDPIKAMRGLWQIARSAGWMVPHEHVCWISERPRTLEFDGRGRLHNPSGPAIQYRDGWSAYCWKGQEVPAWVIEHPERITVSTLADTFDPVLRNCMLEIMTPERFVGAGGASCVSRDETGILWRKSWGYRGATIGTWCAVEVVNGTADQNGSHKHYFLRVPSRMRSAREAVAWTYGLTAEQYAGLTLRT